ncbi:MAG TPA: hypothetical protein VN643_03115 [Pyrinomonadaceae bacterium]|nr:hypothetical protein [Pyrinomonadaceae bacterium]
MWTKVVDLARVLFTFSEGLQQNRADIKELQRELRDLTSVVQQLSHEIRRVAENDSHEREKLGLRLENEMLKFERRLPNNFPKEITNPMSSE